MKKDSTQQAQAETGLHSKTQERERERREGNLKMSVDGYEDGKDATNS